MSESFLFFCFLCLSNPFWYVNNWAFKNFLDGISFILACSLAFLNRTFSREIATFPRMRCEQQNLKRLLSVRFLVFYRSLLLFLLSFSDKLFTMNIFSEPPHHPTMGTDRVRKQKLKMKNSETIVRAHGDAPSMYMKLVLNESLTKCWIGRFMIPPTCRAMFIIHVKYSVHNIIVNVAQGSAMWVKASDWAGDTEIMRATGRRRASKRAKQRFCRVKQNMKMLKFPLNPFICVHFAVGYILVSITWNAQLCSRV